MQRKIQILSVFLLLAFLALTVRIFYWQVIKAGELSESARFQHNSAEIKSAPRGNILSSDGSFWAVRTPAWHLWANPKDLKKSPKEVADRLAPFLVEDVTVHDLVMQEEIKLETALSKPGTSWVSLTDKVSDDVKKNIEALKIAGIGFDPEEARFYPEASSAAQLLGFVGKNENGEDKGYFGLEGYYDLPLSGKPGFLGGEKDAKGAPILVGGSQSISAISGVDLVTSIDKRIQVLAEEKLKEGIEKYGAAGGSVTIMEPFSGKVLAMASLPSYDPSKYRQFGNNVFKNPVISDTFEPGSIFKVLVMAAGLDSGLVKPDTTCDICSGSLKVDKYQIETWNNKYHPDATMTDVIVDSDNVGMAFVGQKLGTEALYDYLDKFGIGKITGIDLQGEAASPLRKKGTWNIVDLATASFGQGVAVTGIEMMRAVSAIANGGLMVTPKVVDILQGDGWQEHTKVSSPMRIISAKAAGEMAQMMVEAANRGEAKWTKIPGFNVAGKTGTAQIPVAGHYDPTKTNHSFIGFAPVDKPKFVMLVTLQSPQSSPWAAETAAPLWYSIAKELFPYLGVHPDN